MELYFTCPVTKKEYRTDRYNLQKGYRINTDDNGKRCLEGDVKVHIPCPHCGTFHKHNIQQIACPLEKLAK